MDARVVYTLNSRVGLSVTGLYHRMHVGLISYPIGYSPSVEVTKKKKKKKGKTVRLPGANPGRRLSPCFVKQGRPKSSRAVTL